MALITHEEIVRIARMSHIELTQEEMEKMQSHVEAVLSYAARVQDLSAEASRIFQSYTGEDAKAGIAKDVDIAVLKNSNVEREDVMVQPNPEPIRAQAPEREGDFFVVPVIIETT